MTDEQERCYCGEPIENDPATDDGQAKHLDPVLDADHTAWSPGDQ